MKAATLSARGGRHPLRFMIQIIHAQHAIENITPSVAIAVSFIATLNTDALPLKRPNEQNLAETALNANSSKKTFGAAKPKTKKGSSVTPSECLRANRAGTG
jgi:hypothetical protein